MRSIWKGHIRFSLVTIPVRLYTAVASEQTIHFNLLHKTDHGNIGYDKRCKKCGQTVTQNEIVKGYEFEPGQYVVIEPQDLQKLKLKSTKAIEIEGFVAREEVPTTLYEAPYYLGPDGAVGAKSYGLLHEVLKDTGKVGAGKVVLHDREDLAVIAPLNGALALYKLRYPNEVRTIEEVPELSAAKNPAPEELKLARHLVETMTTSFSDLKLKDTYQEALHELIQAKLEGKEVVQVGEPERPVIDIMTALRQSIEQHKSMRKPMVKATGKRAEEAAAVRKHAGKSEAKTHKARRTA